MDRPDDPAGRVRAGNEWVVAARLADAKFFFEKDRAVALVDRRAGLASLTFQEKLGSYAEKSARLAVLAEAIASAAGVTDLDAVRGAAELLKVDLGTDMVKEFTDLQGVVGGLYARAEGAPESVWQAIYDQYRPAGSTDALPRGAIGQVAALADRIDSLAGFFGLGMIPTGSKDPFGLRRAALGVVRILLEGALDIDVEPAITTAFELLEERMRTRGAVAAGAKGASAKELSREQARAQLVEFLRDRLTYVLGERGFAYDEIAAAMGATGGALDFRGIAARAAALQRQRQETSFAAVAQAAKRIANITKGSEAYSFDLALAAMEAERELAGAAAELRLQVAKAREGRDIVGGLASVRALALPLERFFTDVLVMDPDPQQKQNRIALLQSIQTEILWLADLSQMVIDRSA